ncbi:MAG: Fic family protein [Flavobacteriaceae bacterium]|nr:MAG: Fic family protein [Flavobacteriaceae bacterium]
MNKDIELWKPIRFDDEWNKTDTSKLDDILPSWYRKREILQSGSKEYEDFLNRLKRQHAIETGIVERLYDLKEGITETFIKEGFVESYLQHGDTNISPNKLIGYLSDHFEAIDFIFDVVKNERPISKNFILQLHQLITKNQDFSEAIDTLGRQVRVPLLKGKFKEHENNPRRSDGTKFIYCPPIHVENEIDKLINIYEGLEDGEASPIVISAWFHHAFSIIHPFQDGNGRLARLLASLILIKHGLFPFTVKRTEKKRYIEALENADTEKPNELVVFFSEVQKRNIEVVLNLKLETVSTTSISDIASALSKKVNTWKDSLKEARIKQISDNRNLIFNYCNEITEKVYEELRGQIPEETAGIYLEVANTSNDKYYYFTHQIVEYAKEHDYFFNRSLPRDWFKLSVVLSEKRQYQIILSMHHYGYDDTTMAVGAFLEFIEPKTLNPKNRIKGYKRTGNKDNIITSLPLNIKPHTISLEGNVERVKHNLQTFVRDTLAISLAQIMNEIN